MRAKDERATLRAERKAAGRCLDCNHDELTKTACGDPSRYCDRCLPRHATGKPKPVIVKPKDIEVDDEGNPLPFTETRKGKAYELVLRRAIKRLGTRTEPRVRLSQIKAFLGEAYDEDNTLDTLASLVGGHLLEWRQMGAFWSWVYVEPRVEVKRSYMGAAIHRPKGIIITPAADKSRPNPESYGCEVVI